MTAAKEGFVKYAALHEDSPAIDTPGWSELNEARNRCRDLGLIGVYANGVGYGNLSVRVKTQVPGKSAFLISGTATGAKKVLEKQDYCLVKSIDIERNQVTSAGPIQASAESMTHGAVYLARSGVNCVIHIHSRVIFDGMTRAGNYPFTPKEAAFGTPEIALAVMRRANETGADEGQIVLAGHDEGIIAYGADVKKALALIMDLYREYGG